MADKDKYAPAVFVGDRMKITVALIKQIVDEDPEGFTTATVRVARIETEPDGTKTLWMERV
jgi:hypothetical protein